MFVCVCLCVCLCVFVCVCLCVCAYFDSKAHSMSTRGSVGYHKWCLSSFIVYRITIGLYMG